ncbi:MAG TPA: leucine-rich repeat domain-containing protein, partial [Anseongella sp.]|nr:leucine-rich repeat domain-containing protein [Anseongella sp.]
MKKLFILIILLGGLGSRFKLQAQTCPNEGNVCDALELAALNALYASSGGSAWTPINWQPGSTTLARTGVTVVNGDVVAIDLHHNNMIGTIPPELANLTQLQSLALYSNSAPSNRNKLEKLPDWIQPGDFPNLKTLNLSRVGLTGNKTIPPALANLTALETLILSHNGINSSIPDAFENLLQLKRLDLYMNGVTALPAGIGKLTNLTYLDLTTNDLRGDVLPRITGLTQLQYLSFGNNELTGKIPPGLGNLTSLQVLNLSQNSLSGQLPGTLGNLTALTTLNLRYNAFTGPVPVSLSQLTALTSLNLSFNRLEELPNMTFPATLALDVSSNKLDLYDLGPYFTGVDVSEFTSPGYF